MTAEARKRARLRGGRIANLAAALLRADAFVLGRQVFLSASAAQSIGSGSPAGLALLAHELRHVEQYRRHGIPRFLGRYFSEYLAGRLRALSHSEAYAAITFEREAQEDARRLRDGAAPVRAGRVNREGSPADLRRDA